jgi:ribonuclease E
MVLEANRDLVLRRLTECLARDRTRHQVAEVTSLGLVQMTRKRVGGGLLEHFSTPCEHCRGRGVIVNSEPVTGGAPRQEHVDRPERETRRSRGGRGRRDGEDRNGHDVRRPEPVTTANGSGGRNGSHAETATADASVDVGAPDPVVTPAVLDPAPAPSAEPTAPTGRRVRRSARRGVVQTSPAAGPVDVAADAVEEVVVERTVAAAHDAPETTTAAPEAPAPEAPAAETAVPDVPEQGIPEQAAAEPALREEEPGARPRRRRGRVTRTGGAPTATAGDAPVAAVLTVSSAAESAAAPVAAPTPVAVPPQPEPAPAARPRRTRRAASRPAGPPVAEPGDPA